MASHDGVENLFCKADEGSTLRSSIIDHRSVSSMSQMAIIHCLVIRLQYVTDATGAIAGTYLGILYLVHTLYALYFEALSRVYNWKSLCPGRVCVTGEVVLCFRVGGWWPVVTGLLQEIH